MADDNRQSGIVGAIDFGIKLGVGVAAFTATNFVLRPITAGMDALTKNKKH